MWVSLVVSVSCLLAASSGSKILFSATPDVIQSNLTQAMTMRCSLNDTDPLPSVGGIVGKRDVTTTVENMQTISSIVITRNNGDQVATLIQGQPAKAVTDMGTMQVHGSLSGGSNGEQGYIELDWIYPTTTQTGEYVCEINTISSAGHNIPFVTSMEIGESVPTVGELMYLVMQMEHSKTQLQEQINSLQQNISNWAPPALATPTGPRIETGVVRCANSDTWPTDSEDDWANSETLYTTFHPAFSKPPHVHVAVDSLDHDHGDNVRYDVFVTNVNENSFGVKCKTWHGSKIFSIRINYLAIGS